MLNERLAASRFAKCAARWHSGCAIHRPARQSCSTSSSRRASTSSTPRSTRRNDVVLGAASVLAEQPEFASADSMRRLVALTETRQTSREVLRKRSDPGVSITIGTEHDDPALENFTVVTAQYHVGALTGVIGVIGPTRMPYDKVISLVTHTSQLVTDLLD